MEAKDVPSDADLFLLARCELRFVETMSATEGAEIWSVLLRGEVESWPRFLMMHGLDGVMESAMRF